MNRKTLSLALDILNPSDKKDLECYLELLRIEWAIRNMPKRLVIVFNK